MTILEMLREAHRLTDEARKEHRRLSPNIGLSDQDHRLVNARDAVAEALAYQIIEEGAFG